MSDESCQLCGTNCDRTCCTCGAGAKRCSPEATPGLLAKVVAYLNRHHLEDGARPWDEHHAEVHDLVEMVHYESLALAADRPDYPIPALRNEVWNAALAGVAQSNKTQAEYEAFHAFLVWASSQKTRKE